MSDPGDRAFKLRLAEVAQRPIIDNAVPVSQRNPRVHQEHLEWIAKAQSEGLRIFGQGATMRAGFAFALDNWNLYDASPADPHDRGPRRIAGDRHPDHHERGGDLPEEPALSRAIQSLDRKLVHRHIDPVHLP